MSVEIGTRRSRRLATLAFAVAALGAVAAGPARAGPEPYLGWDFGNGVGIGIGPPPSAYDACPTYGWPVYPYPCRYYHHRRIRHYSRRY